MSMHPPTPHLPPAIPAQRRAETMPPVVPTIPAQRRSGSVPVIPAQRHSGPVPVIPAQRRPAHRLAAPEVPAPRPASPSVAPPVIPGQRHAADAVPVIPREPRTVPPATQPEPAEQETETEESLSPVAIVLDALGLLGTAVTIGAALVLAMAVGGLTDGQPVTDPSPIVITFDGDD